MTYVYNISEERDSFICFDDNLNFFSISKEELLNRKDVFSMHRINDFVCIYKVRPEWVNHDALVTITKNLVAGVDFNWNEEDIKVKVSDGEWVYKGWFIGDIYSLQLFVYIIDEKDDNRVFPLNPTYQYDILEDDKISFRTFFSTDLVRNRLLLNTNFKLRDKSSVLSGVVYDGKDFYFVRSMLSVSDRYAYIKLKDIFCRDLVIE